MVAIKRRISQPIHGTRTIHPDAYTWCIEHPRQHHARRHIHYITSRFPLQCTQCTQCTQSLITLNGRQLDVVRWLLENGVDREKPCYYDQTPLDVVGQCRLDTEAASDIREALTQQLKRKFSHEVSTNVQRIWYQTVLLSLCNGHSTTARVIGTHCLLIMYAKVGRCFAPVSC